MGIKKTVDIFNAEGDFVCRGRIVVNEPDNKIMRLQIGDALEDYEKQKLLESYYRIKIMSQIKGVKFAKVRFFNLMESSVSLNNCTIDCEILDESKIVQRRKDICVDIDSICDIRRVKDIEEYERGVDARLDKMPIRGQIKDLSAGGLYFQSNEKFIKGEYISIDPEEIDNISQRLVAIILRVDDYSDLSKLRSFKHYKESIKSKEHKIKYNYGYGCRFIKLPRGVESCVRKLVLFENSRQMREKELNNDK